MDKRNILLIKDTIILTIGNLFSKVLAFVSVFFFTRWISVSDFGTYDLILSYGALIIPIFSLAIYEGTYRNLIEEENIEDRSATISNSLFFVIFGLLILVCLVMFSDETIIDIDKFSALYYFSASSIYTLLQYILRGLKSLKYFAISSILYSFIMFLVGIYLIYFQKMGLNGLILSNGLAYTISSIFIIYKIGVSKYIDIGYISKSTLRSLIFYSVPLLLTGISWWIMNISNRAVINLYLTSSDNGLFAVANKIPSVIAILYSSFQYSWMQSAIDEYKNNGSIVWFNDIFNKVITFLFCMSILVLGLNEFIFDNLFIEAYFDAKYHMPILTISIVFLEIGTFFGGIYVAKRQTTYQSITFIIPAILNILLCILLIQKIGLFAASISTFFANLLLMALRYYNTKNEFKWKINNWNKILFVITIGYFIMAFQTININRYVFIFISIIINLYCLSYYKKVGCVRRPRYDI